MSATTMKTFVDDFRKLIEAERFEFLLERARVRIEMPSFECPECSSDGNGCFDYKGGTVCLDPVVLFGHEAGVPRMTEAEFTALGSDIKRLEEELLRLTRDGADA